MGRWKSFFLFLAAMAAAAAIGCYIVDATKPSYGGGTDTYLAYKADNGAVYRVDKNFDMWDLDQESVPVILLAGDGGADLSQFSDEQVQSMRDISATIFKQAESEDFLSMDRKGREKLARSVLSGFEKDGLVSDIRLSETGSVVLFRYSTGAIGGWDLDGLPSAE